MTHYPYIIVGGGMTAASALNAIRSVDPTGEIALFSLEANPPYARPPLTKGLWLGKPLEKIWRKIDYPNTELFLKSCIIRVDTGEKEIEDDQGNIYHYDCLLLATGGNPRRLKFGDDKIIYYRTLDDYYKTRTFSDQFAQFGIIGGGFIGCELAASLRQQGNKVCMIFPEDGLSWRIFPPDLSLWVTDYYRRKGVEVFAKDSVESFEMDGAKLQLGTEQKRKLTFDAIIAGIGIIPEVSLANSAGLEVDNGIIVNEYLQTSASDVYAAGDAASFHNVFLGKRMRVEHEDNSIRQGWTAGLNMAGKAEKYDHLPYFYSDMFDLGYEAVGDLDPSLEIFTDWIEKYQKGVVYYRKQGIVRGVLLWNIFGKVDAARQLIQDGKAIPDTQLVGKLIPS